MHRPFLILAALALTACSSTPDSVPERPGAAPTADSACTAELAFEAGLSGAAIPCYTFAAQDAYKRGKQAWKLDDEILLSEMELQNLNGMQREKSLNSDQREALKAEITALQTQISQLRQKRSFLEP